MFSLKDDEPSDPQHFRRTLVPLDIEDAEKPPSLVRRVGRLFRKKRETDRGFPAKPEHDTLPPEGNDDGGGSDQDL
jgi:hypothetical protein